MSISRDEWTIAEEKQEKTIIEFKISDKMGNIPN